MAETEKTTTREVALKIVQKRVKEAMERRKSLKALSPWSMVFENFVEENR